jgi:Zn-dependent protease with chaperone function
VGLQHLVHAAIALLVAIGGEELHGRERALDVASPWWIAAGLCAPYLVARLARRAFVRGRHALGAWLIEALRHSAVVAFAVLALACGWIGFATRTAGPLFADGVWPRASLALALLPWFAFELAAVEAQARARAATRAYVGAIRGFELRMRAMALAPLALLYALLLLVGTDTTWRVRASHVGVLGALHAALVVGVMLLAAPLALRLAMDARPLAHGTLRELFAEVAQRASFHCRELVEWRTGMRMANAAILGLTPRTRIVVFTDALLEQLSPRELCAVYAHEIGHAARHHLLALAAVTVALLVGGGWIVETWLPGDEWWSLLALAPGLPVGLVAVGWLSRRFELEADLNAFDVLGDPSALVSALHRVSGMHAEDSDSWRHFSSARRVGFLFEVAREPALGAALSRRMRAWRRFAIAAAALILLARSTQLAFAWNSDMAWADLRLGEYEQARAREATSDDGSLEALLARASELPANAAERTGERLLARAAAAYDRGEFAIGREWLELAGWRGYDEAHELLDAAEWLAECADDDARSEWRLLALGGSKPNAWQHRLWNADAAARASRAPRLQ